MSRGKNVLRKPVLIGPIEFDIVIVRDMSEKATENKVYLYSISKSLYHICHFHFILDDFK